MQKKLKTILAGILAVAVSVSGTAMTAYADYDPCDVNHDGSVGLSDAILVNRYLNGSRYFPNYNQLDANRSMTVDHGDSDMIMARSVNASFTSAYYSRAAGSTVAFPSISGFTPNAYSTSTQGRTYRRYSYATQTELSSYTLSPAQPLSTMESGDDRAIIGNTDDRYQALGDENTGIVRLHCGSGYEDYATGFIVGDHQIATAAHCVYNCSNNSWYPTMTIQTYTKYGYLTGNTLTAVEAHFPSLHTNNNEIQYDYALITVEEDLSSYVQFDLGSSYNFLSSSFYSIPLYVTGCPGYINVNPSTNSGNINGSHLLYSHEGSATYVNSTVNDSVLYYNIDTTGGQSGSPVYTITKNTKNGSDSYNYTALAVHHGGSSYNDGSMITKYHHQFYKNNPYISY